MSFPEFASKITGVNIELILMEDHCHSTYDIIIGRDFMTKLMIDISFTNHMVTQDGQAVPFHPRGHPVLDASFTGTAVKVEDDFNDQFQSEPENISNYYDDSDDSDGDIPPLMQRPASNSDSSDNESKLIMTLRIVMMTLMICQL